VFVSFVYTIGIKILTSPDVLSKSTHGALELGPLRVKHVSHVIVHLSLVVLVPTFKGSTLWQHGIARLAQLRVDSSDGGHCGCCTFSLRSTQPRWSLSLCLSLTRISHYSVDLIEAFRLARAAAKVVGWSTIEPGKVGNEQRVLDVGQGGESSNLGI
jgi:hypothetical protein